MQLGPEGLKRLNELSGDLVREDDLGKVIRSHVRLEGILLEFVKLSVFHPSHLKKMQLDFDQNLSLALAMGLTEDLGRPLKSLGKLRNDFAHKNDMTLGLDRVKALYECLGPHDKEQIHTKFLELKAENNNIQHLTKYSELSVHDQFVMIILLLWAGLEQAVVELRNETGRA